jgi:alpha-beta hydrolase superfamily lysophospholipase
MVMIHGNSENSDNYLELGMHHALNDMEVHLIDLKGQGLSSGEKNGHFKIQEHHNQVVSMLEQVNPNLPCFIQAHSMGCLCTVTFLINNPSLKIAGVIVGSPFFGFGDSNTISTSRRLIVQFLASFLEELPINGAGSTHHLSHSLQYYIHECIGSTKRTASYVSGGIVNSMMESCEDIHTNAKLYKKPTLCFIGGKEKIV